jgi:hypothetical protein
MGTYSAKHGTINPGSAGLILLFFGLLLLGLVVVGAQALWAQ